MPVTKQKKQEVVKELREKIAKAQSIAFAKFHGLSVAKVSAFRRKVKGVGGEYVVTKKTLLGIALKEEGKEIPGKLEGEVGVIVSYEDALSPFKSATEFAKQEKEAFALLGGIFEGTFVDARTAKALGMIPSREVLVAQVMSVILGNTRKLVYCIDQIQKKKSQ